MRWAVPNHSATLTISALYKRPLQVSRYLRQFPSPRSPNWSLLRQACRNSAHASLRTGRWQVSRYLRQFPSPRSPSTSLFRHAAIARILHPAHGRLLVQSQRIGKRPRPELQKEQLPLRRRRHIFAFLATFLILQLAWVDQQRRRFGDLCLVQGIGQSARCRFSLPPPLVRADLHALHAGFHFGARPCVDYCACEIWFHGLERRLWVH
jgi:hypothetical protein